MSAGLGSQIFKKKQNTKKNTFRTRPSVKSASDILQTAPFEFLIFYCKWGSKTSVMYIGKSLLPELLSSISFLSQLRITVTYVSIVALDQDQWEVIRQDMVRGDKK